MSGVRFPPSSRGYDLREVVSALQKAIRRSQVDEALYWATEMARSGFGNWCWKRLRIICSEDCGPANPGLAADIRALYDNYVDAVKAKDKDAGPGEEYLFLYHAVIALSMARKNRVVDWAIWYHQSDNVQRMEIPDEALDKHTLRGKNLGRGQAHFINESSRLVQPGVDPIARIGQVEAWYLAEHVAANDGQPSFPKNEFSKSKAEAEPGAQSNMLDHETGAK